MRLYWQEQLDSTTFTHLIRENQAILTWFYGQDVGQVTLSLATHQEHTAGWAHGIYFGATAELSWWKTTVNRPASQEESKVQDDCFTVRWLGETIPTLLTAGHTTQLNYITPSGHNWAQSATQLYGRRETNHSSWAEARIPRHLHYPWPDKDGKKPPEQLTLQTETYWHPTRQLTITRLCTIEAAPQSEQEG